MRHSDPVVHHLLSLSRGGVYFDIGANIGDTAEPLCGFARRVVAVEADDDTFSKLSTRLIGKAACVHALIGTEGEARTWLSNTANHTGSTSVAIGDAPKGHDYLVASRKVSVSLDSLAERHGTPDLIKIDIEGHEMAALRSAKRILASQPIVIAEFNALALMNFGRVNPRDALDELFGMFHSVSRINGEALDLITDRYAFIVEHVLQRGSVDNLVCQ